MAEATPEAAAMAPRRAMFVSMECLGPLFSGNGVYARSLIGALRAGGTVVGLVSGAGVVMEEQDDATRALAASLACVAAIPLPASKLRRLDVGSGWAEFIAGAGAPHVVAAVAGFAPDVLLAVDWHGAAAAAALRAALPSPAIPIVYLNFRVFSTSTPLFASHPADAAFYRAMERAALAASHLTLALCRRDALALFALAADSDPVTGAPDADDAPLDGRLAALPPGIPAYSAAFPRALPAIRILLPPLRSDIATAAAAHTTCADESGDSSAPPRTLLTCAVRLSPEKGADAFAAACCTPAAEAALAARALHPFLCGSAGDVAYADGVRTTLARCRAGAELESAFMDTAAMTALFSRTLLNAHPAPSDAVRGTSCC